MEGVFQLPGDSMFGLGFLGLLIAICLISIVLLVLIAIWMYRDAESRRMDATVWLVLLILGTVFGGFVGLIVIVVVYLIVRGGHPVGGAYLFPPGPYPAFAPPSNAPCPVCGSWMTWVPQYARWYCPRCAQYR